MKKQSASPASFFAALLCFLLPFATVRCTDNPYSIRPSFRAWVCNRRKYRKRNKKNQGNYGLKVKDVIIESNPGTFGLFDRINGVAASFMKTNESTKRKIATSAAILAIFCLAGMWFFTDEWCRSQNMPLVIEHRFGFYLLLGCFIAAAIVTWLQKTETVQEHPAEVPSSPVEFL